MRAPTRHESSARASGGQDLPCTRSAPSLAEPLPSTRPGAKPRRRGGDELRNGIWGPFRWWDFCSYFHSII